MTLPVPIKMARDATPLSFASALAYVNGFSSLEQFLNAAEISPGGLGHGEPEATRRLAYWSGEDSLTISRYAIKPATVEKPWTLGEARFSKESRRGATYRLCPRCILNDVSNGTGTQAFRTYVRAAWMTRAVQNCTIHSIPLIDFPLPAKACEDFTRMMVTGWEEVKKSAERANTVITCDLDRHIVNCIHGTAKDCYLARFETYVAADLCNYLGQFIKRHWSKAPSVPGNLLDGSEREIGFWVANQGDAEIRSTVSAIITNARRISNKGFQFGTLALWLKRNVANPAHAELVGLFHDIAVQNIRVGPGNVCFLPVQRRRVHSVKTAAKEYGLVPKRVFRLVLDAGLIGPTERPYHEVYFSAALAHDVLSAATETLTSRGAREQLGVTEVVFTKLLDEGIIPRVESHDEGRVYSRILRSDFDEFKQAVFANAASVIPINYQPIGAACQRVGCSQAALLSQIVNGSIKNVAAEPGHNFKISRIWVDVAEIKAVVSEDNGASDQLSGGKFPRFLTRHETAHYLKTTHLSVAALIEQGFLITAVENNRTCVRKQVYVTGDSVAAFATAYISVADLAANSSTHPIIVRRVLEQMGVKPINESAGRVTRFFRKLEVVHSTFVKPVRCRARR
ncbi:hypothetical protein [Pararhizobium sp. DWP3-4]|uniref:hypothetical protein n=1 Tax=Pararhizobium sp. DWP3-4 TaxID=2804565 RepID=UPI003CFB1FC3